MTVQLQLPAELEEKLRLHAQARGQDLAHAALELLQQGLDSSRESTSPNDLPYEVWQRRFDAMLKDLPRVDSFVDDSRESIYEGRGE
jgi:hypothetical protein